jgi:hypothetical protein
MQPVVEKLDDLRGECTTRTPGRATARACSGLDSRGPICHASGRPREGEFLAVLRSATTWAIDARGMLDMRRADGERVLTAGGAFE